MSIELPDPIAAYIAAENGHDTEVLAQCFTAHAAVGRRTETAYRFGLGRLNCRGGNWVPRAKCRPVPGRNQKPLWRRRDCQKYRDDKPD
jgi:hypothetical protein